jgi:hypothetical protein
MYFSISNARLTDISDLLNTTFIISSIVSLHIGHFFSDVLNIVVAQLVHIAKCLHGNTSTFLCLTIQIAHINICSSSCLLSGISHASCIVGTHDELGTFSDKRS